MTEEEKKALLKQAMSKQQADALNEAQSLYQQVLDQDPKDPDACHGIGLLFAQRKDFEAALPWLEKAVQYAPQYPAFHNNLGNAYKALGRAQEALQHYQEALRLKSPYPEALNNLGRLYYQQGQIFEAIKVLQKAVRENPDLVDAHYNLANGYTQLERYSDAVSHYRQVLKLRPDHLGALHNIGIVLTVLKNFEEAKPHLEQAVKREPNNLDALFHLGIIEASYQNLDKAIDLYQRVIDINPKHANAHHNLATVYLHLNQKDKALEHYQKAFQINPLNKTAQHMIEALEGKTSPEGAPPEYVRALFDQYAYSYDQQVKTQLEYQVPALLREALTPQVHAMVEPWMVLDLGCGTGLCAPFFRDVALKLIGVDLSPNMIEVAQKQGGYDKLVVSDILDYLKRTRDEFQLIIAGDVLVYFADLNELFELARKRLTPPGWFAFSIETQTDRDYKLRPTGRYAHQLSYIQRLAPQHRFKVVSMQAVTLRKQENEPVQGAIVVMQAI